MWFFLCWVGVACFALAHLLPLLSWLHASSFNLKGVTVWHFMWKVDCLSFSLSQTPSALSTFQSFPACTLSMNFKLKCPILTTGTLIIYLDFENPRGIFTEITQEKKKFSFNPKLSPKKLTRGAAGFFRFPGIPVGPECVLRSTEHSAQLLTCRISASV